MRNEQIQSVFIMLELLNKGAITIEDIGRLNNF